MKKQNYNQTMSVSEQTISNLLTDGHTEQTDQTYLLMEASFLEKLKLLGYSPQKGKPFSDYYKAMKEGENSGDSIENMTQLNEAVGGKFNKSRAAYEAYWEFQSPNLPSEPVPQDFSQKLMGSIQVDIKSIWRQTQEEINNALAEKSAQDEDEKSMLSLKLIDSDELIDELRGQLVVLEGKAIESQSKMEELFETKAQLMQLEQCQIEIESLQDRDAENQRVITELNVMNRQLEIQAHQLMEQNQRLQQEYEFSMAERYRLEGRLEQHLSEQI
ncbi:MULTISPECIES: hypothetical protein [Vibrio]|uniref:KfrA N-terminal DNA-binding domain-containing protein n=1 Tax=Vibrio diabolicus TaxID=50719 RepID=A0ABN5HSQ8_9VIBR|nr:MULTISPECIES: hypothetical protein [Vibrio]AVH30007.1 hypothetical protein AL468_23135 [Vibrio diabolicus]MBT0109034.1 hypothetical protein [Vibrio alginolyticus]MCR9673146.1 hypothetical protein [Vibrio alginolyticus]MCS0024310.1 hypothetical protein [Vibrio antiquarius]MDW1961816.1 hypothetical protein [Vibrio sp. 661]